MFIVYPQLIKKTHLAWKCHRLCTFKLSGNFPSRRILLSRNVNVPGTIGSPQPAGTDSHLPPVPSAPRRALSCAVLRFFHQDRLAAQFYHIAPDMQHLLSDHCKLHASLRRMLVARLILKEASYFRPWLSSSVINLCTISSIVTGHSCSAPFFLYPDAM